MPPDPARTRFFMIALTRLVGIGFLFLGVFATSSPKSDLPEWIGYLALAAGVLGMLIVPRLLANRWRSPD